MTIVIILLCIIAFLMAPELWIILAAMALRAVFLLLIIGLALALLIGLASDAPYILAGVVLAVSCLWGLRRFGEWFEGTDGGRGAVVPAPTAAFFHRCATTVAILGSYAAIFAGLLSCVLFFGAGLAALAGGIGSLEGGIVLAGLVIAAAGGFGMRYFWRELLFPRTYTDQTRTESEVI